MERVSALQGQAKALGDSSGGAKEFTARLRRLRARFWPLSIRQYLVLLFLIIAAPLSALAFLATDEVAKADRNASRAALMASARALAATIDREISRHVLLAEQLGQSRSLLDGNFVEFWQEAKDGTALLPDTWISLVDPTGRVLVNTLKEPGDVLPVHVNTEFEEKAFLTKQPQVSDLFVGAVAGRTIASVDVPVFRDGVPAYLIGIALDPARFQRLFEEQHFPEGWLIGLLDRQERFIARLPWGSARVGASASDAWRANIRLSPEGINENHNSIEGYPIVGAYTTTDYGWTVGLSVRANDLDAPLFSVQRRLAVSAGFCLLLSGTLGWLAGRKLVRQTERLLRTAEGLAREKQIDWQSTGIREYDFVQLSFADTQLDVGVESVRPSRADFRRTGWQGSFVP